MIDTKFINNQCLQMRSAITKQVTTTLCDHRMVYHARLRARLRAQVTSTITSTLVKRLQELTSKLDLPSHNRLRARSASICNHTTSEGKHPSHLSQDLGVRGSGFGVRIFGVGCMVRGEGSRVSGFGFWGSGFGPPFEPRGALLLDRVCQDVEE